MVTEADRDTDLPLDISESEAEDSSSGSLSYQINTFPADFTLEVLHQKWKNDDFEIPEFQRGFVWKLPQSSKLIESFLLGLPVPPIFLFTSRERATQLVVDGQQRLKTVFYYFEGFFGPARSDKRTVFALKGLHEKSPYLGKTFEQLSERDQRRLKDCVLRSFIIQQLDPEDDTSVYHVFERLNTGGTTLSNQEVRNCVYRGEFTDLLRQLNSLPAWRSILGVPHPDPRQRDIELILRFFSLLHGGDYKKPLKDFMSTSMKRLNGHKDMRALQAEFTATCERVLAALGQRSFHVKTSVNPAVLDSMMIGIVRAPSAGPERISQMRAKALDDIEYKKAIRDATTDVEVVRKRLEVVAKLLS